MGEADGAGEFVFELAQNASHIADVPLERPSVQGGAGLQEGAQDVCLLPAHHDGDTAIYRVGLRAVMPNDGAGYSRIPRRLRPLEDVLPGLRYNGHIFPNGHLQRVDGLTQFPKLAAALPLCQAMSLVPKVRGILRPHAVPGYGILFPADQPRIDMKGRGNAEPRATAKDELVIKWQDFFAALHQGSQGLCHRG